MDLQQLKTKINLQNGKITLLATDFTGTDIDSFLQDFFTNDQLIVDQAVVPEDTSPPKDPNQLILNGILGSGSGLKHISGLSSKSVNLTATFTAIDGSLQLDVSLKILDHWTLPDLLGESALQTLGTDLSADLKRTFDFPVDRIEIESILQTFTFTFKPDLTLKLNEISAYFKGANPTSLFLQDTFPKFDGHLTFESFEVGTRIPSLRLNHISAGLSLKTPLPPNSLFENLINFTGFKADILVLNPLISPSIHVQLSATVTLATVDMEAIIFLPDRTFSFGLQEGKTIDLTSALRNMGLSIPENLKIECDQLSFSGDPANSTYDFEIHIKDNWEFELGSEKFAITDLGASMQRITGSEAETSGSIYGTLKFGEDIQFAVTASHEPSVAGWQFSGIKTDDQQIKIGLLIGHLTKYFKIDTGENFPKALEGLDITRLGLTFNTDSKDFTFICEGQFTVDNKPVAIIITITLTHDKTSGTFSKEFGGSLFVDNLEFDLTFEKTGSTEGTDSLFVGSFYTSIPHHLDIKTYIHDHISEEVSDFIPPGLDISFKDILLAYHKELKGNVSTSDYLFGISLAASLNLSNLPLIGKALPASDTLGVDNLQIVIASANITPEELEAINGLVPHGVTPLPAKGNEEANGEENNKAPKVALKKGFNIAAEMNLGGVNKLLSLPSGNPPPGNPPPDTSVDQQPNYSKSDKTKWFKIQKNFGPAHFDKVGVQMTQEPDPNNAGKQRKVIRFLLTAGMDIGPLAFTLDGLYLGMPLDDLNPKKFDISQLEFGLHGLSLDFHAGPLEIGGSFLRVDESSLDANMEFEFDGSIIIGFKTLSLKAIGSYAKFKSGDPSLFIFGVLDYPLGGPPFLFVTGLAAGFGYNRQLRVPEIDKVRDFPLIAEAVPGGSVNIDTIRSYVPPRMGEYFFAAGIQFTSFKLVEAQALITVSFGNSFELDLLGLARVVEPPVDEDHPDAFHLAVVELAIKVAYIADRGLLEAVAQLTAASYVLSKDCHLTGGFAFYTWFKDDSQTGALAGDFVLSIGGYHPEYKKPDFYPTVPILGFNWKLTDSIEIKGGMYFALVPTAVMAGGYLSATYTSDHLKAWFDAGADFLISWKPYHYDIRVYIHVGGTATFWLFGEQSITLQLGADLHVWGPDFQGTAVVDLFVISIPIDFSTSANTEPDPISWNEFKKSFLPPAKDQHKTDKTVVADVLTVSVGSGLISTAKDKDQNDIWIVDPKNLTIVIDSVMPITTTSLPDNTEVTGVEQSVQLIKSGKSVQVQGEAFGVAPVQQLAGNMQSILTVEVKEGEINGLAFMPITKNVPAALWGDLFLPDVNSKKYIQGALTGFTIKPGDPFTAPHTQLLDRSKLTFSPNNVENAFQWNKGFAYDATILTDEAKEQVSEVSKLLVDLGYPKAEVNVTKTIFSEFMDDPIMVQ